MLALAPTHFSQGLQIHTKFTPSLISHSALVLFLLTEIQTGNVEFTILDNNCILYVSGPILIFT